MTQFLFLLQTWTDEEMAANMDALGSSAFWVQLVPIVYWLVIAAAAIAVILSLMNMLKNPQSLVGFLIGLGVLAALFFVGYMLSNGDVPAGYESVASEGTSKMIGAGIFTVGILMLVGLVFLVLDLIRGIFKF